MGCFCLTIQADRPTATVFLDDSAFRNADGFCKALPLSRRQLSLTQQLNSKKGDFCARKIDIKMSGSKITKKTVFPLVSPDQEKEKEAYFPGIRGSAVKLSIRQSDKRTFK